MSTNFMLCILCFLANALVPPTVATSMDSADFSDLDAFDLAFRSDDTHEEVQDKVNLIDLFTRTKREVDSKMLLLNKLHGYLNSTYDAIHDIYGYYNNLKRKLVLLTHLGFSRRRGGRRRLTRRDL